MAMRLCYVPEMKEEVQRIAEAAVTAGVITDNADNALFHVAENRSASVSILGTTIGLAPTSYAI